LLPSCERASSGDEPPTTQPAKATPESPPPAKARAFDLVPQPQAAGVSEAGAQPGFTFFSPHITKGSRFDVKDLDVIVKHASFISQRGQRVAARADETTLQQHPEQGHYFTLTPVQPPEVNDRYELEIIEDESVRVLAPARFHESRDHQTYYRVRLSTGDRSVRSQRPHVRTAAQGGLNVEDRWPIKTTE